MKTFDCLTTYITENLAINIDLTSTKSFNPNDLETTISLTKWNGSKTSDIQLDDYGLTCYDNGLTNNMNSCQMLLATDNKLKLKRAKFNDISGNTSYDSLDLSVVTGTSTGTYINLNGGYFQNYFKLFGYEHELFSPRYNLGITIETLINTTSGSTGLFYTMGVRAEDKYNTFFSGETEMSYDDKSIPHFNGVTTSAGDYLTAYIDTEYNKKAFSDFALMKQDIPIENKQIDNIKENIIAFGIDLDKRLYYRTIDLNGNITENYSENIIKLGWNLINITFKPDELIFDYNSDECLCYPRRKGSLIFSVNGKQFWKIDKFDEFYFKQINNNKEKNIGIPFNISWGGGTYGLKHSYHYDWSNYNLFNNNDQTYINSNFTTYDKDYAPISGVTLIENNTLFVDELSQPISVLEIENIITTNKLIIGYNTISNILPNRIYEAKCLVNLNGGSIGTNNIMLDVVSNTSNPINIIENIIFSGSTNITGDWTELKIKFSCDRDCGNSEFKIGVAIVDEINLISTTPIYIKLFSYKGQDKLLQDSSKEMLIIEKYFNETFIGGIQKLRIYDRALTGGEVFGNAFIESKNNPNLNINITKGGRLIYK